MLAESVWEGEGVVLSALGMFDDLTPGDGVVEWAHLGVQHTFIVHFHHLILHHRLSQAHFDNGEVCCLCETEKVSRPFKDEMQFAVGW